MNPYIPGNNRAANNPAPMGNYGGQGVKRMRGDDFRPDGASAPHRMKWNSGDEEKNTNFMERNDVDQRSEYDNR